LFGTELASGNTQERVPFGALQKNQRQFVDPKYHPVGFKFEDPRNIKKDTVLKFCRHVHQREVTYGITEAFRFLKVQRGKELEEVRYGIRADEERAAQKALKQKAAREARAAAKRDKRAKGKNKAKARNRELSPDPTLDPVADGGLALQQNSVNVAGHSAAFAIDPVLLGPHGGGEPQPTAVPEVEPEHILIGEADMRILMAMRHPILFSANGPNEGAPLYAISPSVHGSLQQYKNKARDLVQNEGSSSTILHQNLDTQNPDAQNSDGQNSDTQKKLKARPSRKIAQTLEEPRPARKRGLNADAQTIEEAKQILRPRRRSRRGK